MKRAMAFLLLLLIPVASANSVHIEWSLEDATDIEHKYVKHKFFRSLLVHQTSKMMSLFSGGDE